MIPEILSGMHHSRIKYPDEKKPDIKQEQKADDKPVQNAETITQNVKNENKTDSKQEQK